MIHRNHEKHERNAYPPTTVFPLPIPAADPNSEADPNNETDSEKRSSSPPTARR
eukprot:m.247301 g.247301  ORF g.247301 m.247301 type:complete len:54 (+) comp54479_c0_seq39:1077-1238(+)